MSETLIEKCRYAFHSSRKGYLGERITDYEQQGMEAAIQVVLEEMLKEHEGYDGVIFYINRFASDNGITLPTPPKGGE